MTNPRHPKEIAKEIKKRRTLAQVEAENAVLWGKVRELQAEIERTGLDSRRMKALSAQHVHWGWGQTSDDFFYCCAVAKRLFRERTLAKLADELIRNGHSK